MTGIKDEVLRMENGRQAGLMPDADFVLQFSCNGRGASLRWRAGNHAMDGAQVLAECWGRKVVVRKGWL